jgi:hypothetical protein
MTGDDSIREAYDAEVARQRATSARPDWSRFGLVPLAAHECTCGAPIAAVVVFPGGYRRRGYCLPCAEAFVAEVPGAAFAEEGER